MGGDTTSGAATAAADNTKPDATSSADTNPSAAATVAATTNKSNESSSTASSAASTPAAGSSTPTPGAAGPDSAPTFSAATDQTVKSSTTSATTTATSLQHAAATFDPTATPATDAVKSFVNAVAQLPSLLQPIAPGLVAPLTQLMAQLPKLLAPILKFMANVEVIVRSITHALFPDWSSPTGISAMTPTSKGLVASWTTAIAMVAPALIPAIGQLPVTFSPQVPGSAPTIIPQLLSAPFGIAVSPPQATIPASSSNPLAKLPGQIAKALREALRTVSLAELALAALPGLAGLLVFFMTGVRIGHRQAKFGFAMEMTGIMRFAPTGPLGIVRTGSFVAVSAKKAAPVPAQPRTRRGRRHLELVA